MFCVLGGCTTPYGTLFTIGRGRGCASPKYWRSADASGSSQTGIEFGRRKACNKQYDWHYGVAGGLGFADRKNDGRSAGWLPCITAGLRGTQLNRKSGGSYCAVVASISRRTAETRLAGIPTRLACSCMRASFGARYTQYTLSPVT